MRRFAGIAAAAFLLCTGSAAAQDPPPSPPMPGEFEQIGHSPLMNRGMNAALAVLDGYAYVGSRTDGTHANAGVFVVDVRDPTSPTIVKEIGPPDEGLPTQTSREMRILPDQKLLIVLNHQCSELIHRCAAPSITGEAVFPSNFKVYDIAGENAADPKLVATILPSASGPQTPHEFFVWNDPRRSGRVLLYYTDPGGDEQVVVTDISRVREGAAPEIAKVAIDAGGGIHSLTVSNDGRRLHLAALTGGFIMADTSDLAENKAEPKIRQLTAADEAPVWDGPGAHSAVAIPGRNDHVMITDEVYGQIPGVLSSHGCPWGWVRFIDAAEPLKPVVVSEYKLPVNDAAYCEQVDPLRNSTASWSAHNPTLTEHLALLSWHSAGLEAIDTTNPAAPTGAAEWRPEPLPVVQTEDPLLSSGPDKVVVWSFPVIVDGLVYVVDLRNGLYVLRYRGPHEEEVARVKFLDGNSNSGDAQRMDPVGETVPEAGPAVGGRAPCLAPPLRLRGTRLGPFALGMRRSRVLLRGGPPTTRTAANIAYCVQGGARAVVRLQRGKTALVAVTSNGSGVTGVPRKYDRRARRVGRGLVILRRKKVAIVGRVGKRRSGWVGITHRRITRRALARLERASGL